MQTEKKRWYCIMKIVILGGFLGSGKTSVLLQFARYLTNTCKSEKEHKVVILENEISDQGIDNQVLQNENLTVQNVFSGCICCTNSGYLVGAVKEIQKTFEPEWLLIEATGLAYPGSISDIIFQHLNLKSSVLVLVDAKRWKRVKLALPDFAQSQVSDAKVVLINKIDLVAEEKLHLVEKDIEEINGDSYNYKICAIQPQNDSLWKQIIDIFEQDYI